jgi:hypothetical protein
MVELNRVFIYASELSHFYTEAVQAINIYCTDNFFAKCHLLSIIAQNLGAVCVTGSVLPKKYQKNSIR